MPVVLQTSPFDQVFGLPVHPLVVHAAVVLLPLGALAVLACVLVPPLRRRVGGLSVLVLAAGIGAAFVARLSGELLAGRVERPVEHAFWGGILPWVALASGVAAAAWWAAGASADRRARTASGPATGAPANPVGTIAGGIAAILALVVLGMTVVVGHSGSAAVWGDLPARGGTPTPAATPDATATTPAPSTPVTPSGSPSATPAPATALPAPSASAPAARYTLAEVQQRDTSASCWAVVDGTVYDLTDWVSRHPGGAQRILGLCGRDASADFAGQHAADALPNETLQSFRIGELAR